MSFSNRDSRVLVRYAQVRHLIQDADLLLLRRRGVIAALGRGEHCHAAKAAWWDEDLFCLETRAWVGARAITLSSQVRRHPGRIDVYQANAGDRWPHYNRRGAVRFMRRLTGSDYGYLAVLGAGLRHLPILRMVLRPEVDDRVFSSRLPFCSHACAMADRLGGGVDPVPHLADRLTEPADLARSPFYQYLFTLLP